METTENQLSVYYAIKNRQIIVRTVTTYALHIIGVICLCSSKLPYSEYIGLVFILLATLFYTIPTRQERVAKKLLRLNHLTWETYHEETNKTHK